MKIVLKKDFAMTLNGRPFVADKGDIIDTTVGYGDIFLLLVEDSKHPYDIIESDEVLEPKELEEVVVFEAEQTEEDAIEAEIERSIVEDEQDEVEALEAETVRAEMEDVKPKRKSRKK